VARALGGLFWGFAAVHYPSWINKHGGKDETLWLGLYNACLLIGILVGYGVGAWASTSKAITWRHLYGTEAIFMLGCGITYCFMSPQLIQVTAKVRPLNLLKAFGGSLLVGGGDRSSGTLGGGDSGAGVATSGGGRGGVHSPYGGGAAAGGGLGGGLETKGGGGPTLTSFGRKDADSEGSDEDEDVANLDDECTQLIGPPMTGGMTGGMGGMGGGKAFPGGVAARSVGWKDPEKLRARKAILQVIRSPLYLWTIGTGAVSGGAVCFILYFITQVGGVLRKDRPVCGVGTLF